MSSRSKKKAAHAPAAPVISTHIAFTDGYNKGYEDGLEKGFKESSHILIQRMYAAILIAESEINGSDQDKCIDILNRVHTVLVEALTDEELAQRVLDEVGVEIDWDQPIELAQPKQPVKKGK